MTTATEPKPQHIHPDQSRTKTTRLTTFHCMPAQPTAAFVLFGRQG